MSPVMNMIRDVRRSVLLKRCEKIGTSFNNEPIAENV